MVEENVEKLTLNTKCCTRIASASATGGFSGLAAVLICANGGRTLGDIRPPFVATLPHSRTKKIVNKLLDHLEHQNVKSQVKVNYKRS